LTSSTLQAIPSTKGGTPAWWLDEVLTATHHKIISCYKPFMSFNIIVKFKIQDTWDMTMYQLVNIY